MAWKIKTTRGGRELDEDARLQPTRIIEFTVDNPANAERPFGPFTLVVPAAWSEQQIRDALNAEAAKWANLAGGG